MKSDGTAEVFPISKQEEMIAGTIEPMAQEGLRTLSIAYKDFVPGM